MKSSNTLSGIGRAALPVLTAVAVAGLAACGGAEGAGGEQRADGRGGGDRALLVPTMSLVPADGYTRRREFTGRVEAARESRVGFELGGALAEVAVDEGERIDAGAVLARLDTERLEARRSEAAAALEQARASEALAASTLARIEDARSFDGVSQQEYDEALQAASQSRAARAAAQARLASVDVDLAKSVLRAPFNATVVARLSDEGEVLSPGQPLLDLVERAPPEVRIGITGEAGHELRVGERHTLAVGGRLAGARVRAVLPVRNTATRTVDVILDLERAGDALPGDLARLSLEEPVEADGFWVPVQSLAEGERGLWTNYVAVPVQREESLTAGATHVLEPRPVEIIHEDADRVFVRGALESDELLVTDGLQRVVPGQQVRIGERQARRSAEPDR